MTTRRGFLGRLAAYVAGAFAAPKIADALTQPSSDILVSTPSEYAKAIEIALPGDTVVIRDNIVLPNRGNPLTVRPGIAWRLGADYNWTPVSK